MGFFKCEIAVKHTYIRLTSRQNYYSWYFYSKELQQNNNRLFHDFPSESYILVYSPGHLMHLLNVSPEIVPCLHVAFHGRSVPISPVMEENQDSIASWDNLRGCQTLTHVNREKTSNTSGECGRRNCRKDFFCFLFT